MGGEKDELRAAPFATHQQGDTNVHSPYWSPRIGDSLERLQFLNFKYLLIETLKYDG
jgi:hypothetical protein